MISVMDILSKEPISYDNIRNSVEVDSKTESNHKVENGDIVFVRSSEVRNEVGWAKAYLENEFALYSGFTIRGKKIFDFDAFFVELSINGKNREQIESKAGGSTRFNVSQSILKSVVISEPSLVEQKKISAFFKQLDDTIALHQRKLTLLKQLKEAYLQLMFPQIGENSPALRFAGFSEPWEQRKVSSLAKETYGGGTPKTGVKKYWQGSYPWIQSSDLTINQLHNVKPTKFITEEAIKQSATHNVPGNSIAIVTRVGVGKLALMRYSYSTSQDFLSLSSLNVDAIFCVYCLYKMLQREINNIQGTSIKGITKADLLEKNVSVPIKDEEQIKIGDFFKKIDDKIYLHEKKLRLLFEMKQAFQSKMFI